MTTSTSSAMAMPARRRPWWMTLIIGITLVVVSGLLLWGSLETRVQTYVFLVKTLGMYWLIWGILELVYMFVDRSAWGWKLFMGVISIIAGGSILMYPVSAAIILPHVFLLILGIWALMEGILLFFMAFKGGGWAAGILGVISFVLGLILMGHYGNLGSGLVMLWVGAIWAFISGIALIIQAFMQRKA